MEKIYNNRELKSGLPQKVEYTKNLYYKKEDQRDEELAKLVSLEEIKGAACDGCLEKAEQGFLAADLKKAAEKAKLSIRQEMILEKIYFDNKEQAVIAEEMGVTRSRVWEIKERALRKMRTPQASRILKGWL